MGVLAGNPILFGITKTGLSTHSFISHFRAFVPVDGKVDYLHGHKENVVMGGLIPAGTGMAWGMIAA